MKTKMLSTLLLATALAACSSTLQTASISEAYKKYERAEYEETLTLIARARNTREMHAEQLAEVTFLQAQAHEKLGETDIATTLYHYLAERHPESQFAYLAERKLSAAR